MTYDLHSELLEREKEGLAVAKAIVKAYYV
jgi:hypothetical protein